MGYNLIQVLKVKDIGAIGIGAMIVFIAMVLVAGIAASVLIQTSNTLQIQAMSTGTETTIEVSTGLAIANIEGHNSTGVIDLLAIMIKPRAGSGGIDLAEVVIEISDSTTKNFLTYDDATFTDTDDIDGDVFDAGFYTGDNTHFSIIVVQDADDSCGGSNNAVINSGDIVFLGVDTSQCFSGLNPRDDVWGQVIPEDGSAAMIQFRCPASFTDDVVELQ